MCKSVGLPLFDHWKNLHARYSLQDFKINVFITNIATSFIIFLEPTGYLNHFTNPNNLSTVNLLNEHWTILYLVSFLVKGNKPWIQSKAREERKLSFKNAFLFRTDLAIFNHKHQHYHSKSLKENA